MAYSRRNNNYGKRKNYKKSKYTQVEKMAFNWGLIEQGLRNPDSRVTESYNAGKQHVTSKKKSLF